MGEADRTHVLKRKARTGREEHQARVMTPPRALRLALARVADEMFDLALSVSSIHVAEAGQEQTIAGFADDRMILVLDGADGAVGAVAVEMPILAGLIETQTMGRVLPGAPVERSPTQTDAALVAPLIDGMLDAFAENLSEEANCAWSAGFRYGAMVEGSRMLRLLFEAPDFHVFRMQVDLEDGAKRGEIILALPVARPVADPCTDAGTGAVNGAANCGRTLGQGALMAAQAKMTAELYRLRMPLSEVRDLKPGDVLNIPREALLETRLVAGQGRGVVPCRLGQINGYRAVRMRGHVGQLLETGADQTGADTEMEELGLDTRMAALPGPIADDGGAKTAVEDPDDLDDIDALINEAVGDAPDLGALGEAPQSAATVAQGGEPEIVGDLPDLDVLSDFDAMGDLDDLPELTLET